MKAVPRSFSMFSVSSVNNALTIAKIEETHHAQSDPHS